MRHWLHQAGWRLLPGLLATGVTLLAAHVGVFQPFEHSVYRLLFRIRGEQPWDERVAVIEIDETSLAQIGQFPWPRHYYTELLDQLTMAEASVVAFDIIFAESTSDDAELAQAMKRHGNVIVATAWDEQRGVIGPNARVVQSEAVTGHIQQLVDTDGMTRLYPPKINGTPALSIAAVQRYSQHQPSTKIRDDEHQTQWLNWPGKVQNAPRYSFVDVLNGQVSANELTNKIVFIGFTGVGLDSMRTPYNQSPHAAGVYQHVVAANNLLDQDHLTRATVPVWGMLLLLTPALSYILYNKSWKEHVLVVGISLTLWGCVVVVAFCDDYLLLALPPLGALVMMSLLVRLTEQHCRATLRASKNTEGSRIFPWKDMRAFGR